MLDVRAPIEFAQGSFPNAVNLPLMNDDERQAVGLAYKEKGQNAAIALGHSLVNGAVKDLRVQQWLRFSTANPNGVLYCFRGGLRSQISQQWLAEAGINCPRILGGYKAMRQYLISTFENNVAQTNFTVVGGLTGCGKTDVIRALEGKLDLEGMARHRGSSFGGRAEQQPTQIDFENQLSIHLLKLLDLGYQNVAIEDESNLVGRCAIPLVLRTKTQSSPLVWVTAPLAERVERILRDYIIDLHDDYVAAFGQDEGRIKYQAHLTKSLYNLRKRLGLARFDALNSDLNDALHSQMRGDGFDLHRRWVEPLLTQYYDPMYAYQRQQKVNKPHFEGDAQSVIAFLRQRQASR